MRQMAVVALPVIAPALADHWNRSPVSGVSASSTTAVMVTSIPASTREVGTVIDTMTGGVAGPTTGGGGPGLVGPEHEAARMTVMKASRVLLAAAKSAPPGV